MSNLIFSRTTYSYNNFIDRSKIENVFMHISWWWQTDRCSKNKRRAQFNYTYILSNYLTIKISVLSFGWSQQHLLWYLAQTLLPNSHLRWSVCVNTVSKKKRHASLFPHGFLIKWTILSSISLNEYITYPILGCVDTYEMLQ